MLLNLRGIFGGGIKDAGRAKGPALSQPGAAPQEIVMQKGKG